MKIKNNIKFLHKIQTDPWMQVRLGLFLLACFLFLFRLNYQSLWMDELFSGYWAQKSNLREALSRSILYDVHPPLHTLYLHAWIKIFGSSEIGLRLSSVALAIIAVGTVLWYMPKILSKRSTWISTLLISLAPTTVYYAQNARYNAMLFCFGTILTLQFIDFVIKSKKNQSISQNHVMLFTLVTVLLTFTHYLGTLTAYILFTSILFFRLILKKPVKDFAIGFAMLVTLTIVWFTYIYFGVMPWLTGGHWLGYPNGMVASGLALLVLNPVQWVVVLLFLPFAAYSWHKVSTPPSLKTTGPIIITIPFLGSIVWRANKHRLKLKEHLHNLSSTHIGILCCLFIILTVLSASYVFSILITPIMLPRGFMMVVPTFFIMLGLYFDICWEKLPKIAAVFFTLILLLNLPRQWVNYFTIHKEQWREVSQRITEINKTSKQPLSLILISGFPQIEYYLDRMISPEKMPDIHHIHHLFDVISLKNNRAFVGKHVILVLTDPHWDIWDRQYFYFYYTENYSGAPMFRKVVEQMLNLPKAERVDYYTDIQLVSYPEKTTKKHHKNH